MPDTFFRVEMLPAKHGDALWIEYGTAGEERRILIDGGPLTAYQALEKKLNTLPDGDKRVELMVVTHVDTDHIEGIIRLFAQERAKWPAEPEDIWFNGWRHLEEGTDLGGREGDFLSALISRRAFQKWNKAFERKSVTIQPNKPLPRIPLEGGMVLTLLAPDPDKLKEMADKWREDVDKHGLEPGDLDGAWEQFVDMTRYRLEEGLLGGPKDFEETLKRQLKIDQSIANGTSIAFLAEFKSKSCLFLGDAHPDVVCDSIRKLIPKNEKRIRVDGVKLSHHGSKHNISQDLMKLIDAKYFLVSTDGSRHKHPDKAAIEAVRLWSVRKPTFWFNYISKQNKRWKKESEKAGADFNARYPEEGEEGIVVEF